MYELSYPGLFKTSGSSIYNNNFINNFYMIYKYLKFEKKKLFLNF